MGRNTLIGIIGGALVILATFFPSWGWGISWPGSGSFSLVLFFAGVAVIVTTLLKKQQLARYATVAAGTLAIVTVFTALYAFPSFNVRLQMFFALIGVAGAVYAHFIAKGDPKVG